MRDSEAVPQQHRQALFWRQMVPLTLPVASSYVPLGAAKSMLILSTGVDWYWPIISAFLVFAGSLEYLLASFFATGCSFGVALLTSILVNCRHLFYALSYPMSRHKTLGAKLYAGFALTDEAYILSSLGAGKSLDGPSLIRMHMLLQGWWIAGSLIGVAMFFFATLDFARV